MVDRIHPSDRIQALAGEYDSNVPTSRAYYLSSFNCKWASWSRTFSVNKEYIDDRDIESTITSLVEDFVPEASCLSVGDGTGSTVGLEFANGGFIKHPKLRGLLKARTVTGDLHLRPLCNIADLILAMHELIDEVSPFSEGSIQLPRLLKSPFRRDVCGFYRCVYKVNCKLKWFSVTPNLNKWQFNDASSAGELRYYMCPIMCPEAFLLKELDEVIIHHNLKSLAQSVVKAAINKQQENTILMELSFDMDGIFESIAEDSEDFQLLKDLESTRQGRTEVKTTTSITGNTMNTVSGIQSMDSQRRKQKKEYTGSNTINDIESKRSTRFTAFSLFSVT